MPNNTYNTSGKVDAVNNLFDFLSDDDVRIIACYILLINDKLFNFFDSISGDKDEKDKGKKFKKLHDTCMDISKDVHALATAVNLFDKCVEFVRNNIPIVYVKGGGTREYDTEPKTYLKEDVILLHGLVFMCKVMFPIFGRILYGL